MDLILCMLLVLLGKFCTTSIFVDADTRNSENTKTYIVNNLKTTFGESWEPKLIKKEHNPVHNSSTDCNAHNNLKTSVNDVTFKFKRDTNKFLFKTYSEENQFKNNLNSRNKPEEHSQLIMFKKPTKTKRKMRQRRNPQIAPRPIVNPLMPNPLQPVPLLPPPMLIPNPLQPVPLLPRPVPILNPLQSVLLPPPPKVIPPMYMAPMLHPLNVNSLNRALKPQMQPQGLFVPNHMVQRVPLPNKQSKLNVNLPNIRTNFVSPNPPLQGFPNKVSPMHPVSNAISFNRGMPIFTTPNPTMQRRLTTMSWRPTMSNSARFPISNTISSNAGILTYPLPTLATPVLSLNRNSSNRVLKKPPQGLLVPNYMIQGVPLPNKQIQINFNFPSTRTNLANPNIPIQRFPNIISPMHPVSNTISFNGRMPIFTTQNPTMQNLQMPMSQRPTISNSAMIPIPNTVSSNAGLSTYPLPISSNTNASGCLTFYRPLLLICILIIRSY